MCWDFLAALGYVAGKLSARYSQSNQEEVIASTNPNQGSLETVFQNNSKLNLSTLDTFQPQEVSTATNLFLELRTHSIQKKSAQSLGNL
jgi:hypothetical protein